MLDIAALAPADQPAVVIADVGVGAAVQFDGRAAHLAARVATVGIEPALVDV